MCPRWCRISSINSIISFEKVMSTQKFSMDLTNSGLFDKIVSSINEVSNAGAFRCSSDNNYHNIGNLGQLWMFLVFFASIEFKKIKNPWVLSLHLSFYLFFSRSSWIRPDWGPWTFTASSDWRTTVSSSCVSIWPTNDAWLKDTGYTWLYYTQLGLIKSF